MQAYSIGFGLIEVAILFQTFLSVFAFPALVLWESFFEKLMLLQNKESPGQQVHEIHNLKQSSLDPHTDKPPTQSTEEKYRMKNKINVNAIFNSPHNSLEKWNKYFFFHRA